MIYLLSGIFLVLLSILAVLIVFLYRSPSINPTVVPPQESKSLEDMASIMREDHDEKKRTERDRELAEYASRKSKNVPVQMRSSTEQSERQVKAGRDLIPYGLSESDKRILEEFNS
jgi:hypothetical protein